MAEKMLRGRAPLTMWRGADGVGGSLYRGSLVDPGRVDAEDRDRLIAEGFIEWVVPDGESWKRAEDNTAGEAADPVTVGDAAVVDPDEVDNGTVNVGAATAVDPAAEAERAEARSKLPADGSPPHGNASKAVWVEFAVSKGMSREEAEKADRDDLREALKS